MERVAVQSGQRGPIDHAVRERIVDAANEHFAHFGFGKTTINDLAGAIGFSKAYIYRFFESKQAIGEAICAKHLAKIADAADAAIEGEASASRKLIIFFRTLISKNTELFFVERKLHDIAAYSSSERWPSSTSHLSRLTNTLRQIILAGRESGEFEKKTPIDETCRVILQVMQPFLDPLMLERNLDVVDSAPGEISNLILRSLAP